MIRLMSDLPENTIGIVATGRVSADDYESVLIPAVETSLEDHDKIRLLYYVDKQFDGFDMAAMWDDAKLGLQHLTAWEKIAIVSDIEWIRHFAKFFTFIIPGQVKVFEERHLSEAKDWITS